jgi:hypothetical protein
MDADGGEEQGMLVIIEKSDDSLYNSNDSESGDSFVRRLHCPTIPLFTIPIVLLIAAAPKFLQMTQAVPITESI